MEERNRDQKPVLGLFGDLLVFQSFDLRVIYSGKCLFMKLVWW